jgi:para-aminobenzoate synthetase component 1
MLSWANRFNICCFLDNHQYHSTHQNVECLVAAETLAVFSPTENVLSQLSEFNREHNDWLFGHINYDLKNEINPLQSRTPIISVFLIYFSSSRKLFWN